MSIKSKLIHAAAGAALLAGAQSAAALDELNVAYFLEWPMPFQAAKVAGTYDEELGLKVNWTAFDTGTAMSAAMAQLLQVRICKSLMLQFPTQRTTTALFNLHLKLIKTQLLN